MLALKVEIFVMGNGLDLECLEFFISVGCGVINI